MPQWRARFGIHRLERLRIVAEEDQSTRRAHGPSSRVALAHLRIFPSELSRIQIVGQQDFLRLCPTAPPYSRGIVFVPFNKLLGFQKKSPEILQRQEIEPMRVGIVGRRIPIRRAVKSRAYF